MQTIVKPRRKKLTLIASLLVCFAAWSASAWAQVTNTTQGTSFTDLQTAIDAANSGDVLALDAGTLTPDGTITIDKPLSIQGAGSAHTTIDVSGYNAWGIYITADDVTLSGVTIQGDAVANQQYALKAGSGNNTGGTPSICQNLTYSDIVIQGTKRTAIDLNGVNGATLTDITATGATSGFGMSISSSANVTVTNLTTSGNAWGDVGIFPANSPYQWPSLEGPTGITFDGTIDLSSGTGSISVQDGSLQSGETWVGTISNDAADNADVTVPAGFSHVVNSTRDSDGLVLHNVGPQAAIHANAQALAGSGAFSGTTIDDLDNGDIEVVEGLSIQDAIDAATAGDVIEVSAGTYVENVTLDKQVMLNGEDASTTIIQSATASTPVISITGSGTDATSRLVVSNLTITGATGSGNPGSGILVIGSAACGYMTFDELEITGNGGEGLAFNNTAGVTDVVLSNSNIHSNTGAGLRVASAVPTFDGLIVNGCEIESNGGSGFNFNPSSSPNVGTNFSFENTNFTNNNTSDGNNVHDVSMLGFNGSVAFTNVNVTCDNPNWAMVFGGYHVAPFSPAGAIAFNGVNVTGTAGKNGILFFRYSEASSVSLTGLDVRGLTPGWGSQVVCSHTTGFLNMGNTKLNTLLNQSTGVVDATSATFYGPSDNALDSDVLADNFVIEDQVYHVLDAAGLGLVSWVTGNVYATENSGSIQRAIDAATAGDVINVEAGTFVQTSRINVSKSITLQGAGMGVTVVDVTSSSDTWGMYLNADNIVLQDFTLQADNDVTYGFKYEVGSSGHQATRVAVDGCSENGFAMNGLVGTAGTNILTDVASTNNGLFGIGMGSVQDVTVNNLTASGNLSGDVGIYPSAETTRTTDNVLFQGSVNYIYVDQTVPVSISTSDPTDALYDASAQVTFPADLKYVVSSAIPGVATYNSILATACEPTVLGGILTLGLSDVTVRDLESGFWNVCPELSIQDAIDASAEGDLITISDGTYNISTPILVNKAVTIQGESEAGTVFECLEGLAGANSIQVTAGATLKDFTLNANSHATFGIHVQPGTADAALSGLTVNNTGSNGIGLSGVTNATVSDISGSGNIQYVLGIAGSTGVTASDISGGNVGVYKGTGTYAQTATDIEFTGTFDLSGGFVIEQLAGDDEITYSINGDAADVKIPASFDRVFFANYTSLPLPPPYNEASLATLVEPSDLATAIATAQALDAAGYGLEDAAVYNLTDDQWEVTTSLSIQDAIDRADAGDLIDVAAGTFDLTESVAIDKRLTLQGAGETTVIASSISKAFVVTAGGASEAERLVIRDLAFTGASSSGGSDGISFEPASGTAGHVTVDNVAISNHGQAIHFRTGSMSDARILNSALNGNGNGVRVASAVTSMDGLTLDGCTINDSRSSAFSVNPSGVLENVHTNYTVANSTFANNSTAGVANQHDLSFYGFTGNATLNNVTVTSGNGSSANANAYGIVFTRGGSDFSPLGTVSLTDVTVQGHVGKGALSFQQYSEISGVTLNNVDLTDCVAPWGQLILSHTDSDDFAVGNTALATVAIWNTGGADATSATFYNALTDAELSREVVADGFALEDQIGHRIDLSALGLVTWKANTLFVTANSFAAPYTETPSIQRAADAAAAGDIIHVAAGTYPENVTTAVPLTIEGAGVTTIIQPASGNAITLAAGTSASERTILKHVKATGGVRGVTAGGYTTLEGVEASGNSGAGLWLNAGTDLVLDDCTFDSNNLGVKIPSTVSFDDIAITDCSFDDNTQHGWYSDANSGSEPSLDNVAITRTSFSGNGTKGLYTERLSNATFTELTVAGNGGSAGGVIGQGIDLNLKWADYANISVTNSAFSGNGLGQTMGAALAIKARDDGSTYGANPATLTQVTVSGNTFSGDERAIMLGEPNQTNAGPTAVTINENSFPDAVQFAVVNHAAEEVALTCNWHDAASVAGLNATISGNVDISSALLAGTDGDAATAGFQPSGICTDIGGCGLAAACNYTADLAFPDNSDCEYTSCAGCTLSSACNYDATATVADNASCQFEDALGVCGGDCTSDANDDGICDSEASGCTDATACNYNAFAGQDDGSCEFSSCAGCTSEPACNYDAAATIPAPATCVFPEGCDTCSGATDGTGTVVDNDADNDGVCDADEVEGCTDPQACDYDENATEQTTCDYSSCAGCALPAACNYDAAATISNNASCIFADGCETCSGATDGTGTVVDNDSDDDGVCDDDEVDGCTDPTACDYNPNATDSTACDYASCIGCLNPTACNYDPDATQTGDCTFAAAFSNCDGCINDVNDNQVCDELEQTGCTDPAAVNFNPSAVIDDGSCTSELVGCMIPWAPLYDEDATVQGTPVLDACYPPTGEMPGPPTAGLPPTGCSDLSACNYAPGGDPALDCDYSCFGCTNAAACDYSADAVYNTGCTDFTSCYGCTTSTACNYEADNTFDDGSCEYTSCAGCTDNTACNYDPTATINLPATCVIPTGCDTCSGGTIVDNDADNDGVCDADEVDGCMNANACNYDVNATDSDGSCEFTSCVGCTDSAACNYDASATIADAVNCVFATGCDSCSGATDGTGTVVDGDSDNDSVCDIDEVAGCMNASACNYDATATDSDGSCEFVSCVGCTDATACNYDDSATINEPVTCTYATGCDTCSGATDGTGTVVDGDSDNDSICDADEVSGCQTPGACNYNPAATDAATCDFTSCQGCTDSSACNYDATATQSDGSCTYPPSGYDDCAGTICTDANNNSICDFDESPVLGCMTSTACNYNSAANTNDPSNPCVYLVFEGYSSVTPSSGNRAADGGVTPIISGQGGSGTYFLSLEGSAVETSADGTKVYRSGLTELEGNIPAANWGQLPAGRYHFGLVDDTGCEATATHTVLIPQLTP